MKKAQKLNIGSRSCDTFTYPYGVGLWSRKSDKSFTYGRNRSSGLWPRLDRVYSLCYIARRIMAFLLVDFISLHQTPWRMPIVIGQKRLKSIQGGPCDVGKVSMRPFWPGNFLGRNYNKGNGWSLWGSDVSVVPGESEAGVLKSGSRNGSCQTCRREDGCCREAM